MLNEAHMEISPNMTMLTKQSRQKNNTAHKMIKYSLSRQSSINSICHLFEELLPQDPQLELLVYKSTLNLLAKNALLPSLKQIIRAILGRQLHNCNAIVTDERDVILTLVHSDRGNIEYRWIGAKQSLKCNISVSSVL